jgi:DNA repair protein RecO (recombination protein O)
VHNERARAIVLNSRPLGEADRMLRLFTRELGRVDAVVKGVRKTSSRWGGRLEPYNVCDLMLYQGRTLYTVTQAHLVDVFLKLRDDREALTAAAAGYMPVLDQCAGCGGGERALGFSAARGGLVCEQCLEGAVPITPEAVEALREAVGRPLAELRAAEPTAAVAEALRDVHDLYSYHTGSRLRAVRFARAAG